MFLMIGLWLVFIMLLIAIVFALLTSPKLHKIEHVETVSVSEQKFDKLLAMIHERGPSGEPAGCNCKGCKIPSPKE